MPSLSRKELAYLRKRQAGLFVENPQPKSIERDEDYSCMSKPPAKINERIQYGRVIVLKRMPDGTIWNSFEMGKEPPNVKSM